MLNTDRGMLNELLRGLLHDPNAGPDWLGPDWFRFGASSLLDDLLMQRTKLTTGRYSGPDYVTMD